MDGRFVETGVEILGVYLERMSGKFYRLDPNCLPILEAS